MTQVEMFMALNEILSMSCDKNVTMGEVHDFVLKKLYNDIPKDLKIYSLLTDDMREEVKFTKYGDALTEWKSNSKWKRLESFNPCGEITTIKTRK